MQQTKSQGMKKYTKLLAALQASKFACFTPVILQIAPSNKFPILCLPPELTVHIFAFLPRHDQLVLATSSKPLRCIFQSDDIWRILVWKKLVPLVFPIYNFASEIIPLVQQQQVPYAKISHQICNKMVQQHVQYANKYSQCLLLLNGTCIESVQLLDASQQPLSIPIRQKCGQLLNSNSNLQHQAVPFSWYRLYLSMHSICASCAKEINMQLVRKLASFARASKKVQQAQAQFVEYVHMLYFTPQQVATLKSWKQVFDANLAFVEALQEEKSFLVENFAQKKNIVDLNQARVELMQLLIDYYQKNIGVEPYYGCGGGAFSTYFVSSLHEPKATPFYTIVNGFFLPNRSIYSLDINMAMKHAPQQQQTQIYRLIHDSLGSEYKSHYLPNGDYVQNLHSRTAMLEHAQQFMYETEMAILSQIIAKRQWYANFLPTPIDDKTIKELVKLQHNSQQMKKQLTYSAELILGLYQMQVCPTNVGTAIYLHSSSGGKKTIYDDF